MTFADKTRNIYEMKPKRCNQLLTDNITKNCKLGNEQSVQRLNQDLKNSSTELHINDRIESIAKRKIFISLKDHKQNFENNPKCRLSNPAKSELGKVSKAILDRVNTAILFRTGANQCRDSHSYRMV